MKKRNLFLSFAIVSTLCLTSAVPTFAAETSGQELTQEELENATVADTSTNESQESTPMPRTKNSKSYILPGGKGKITSNAWRSRNAETAGNTYQWDYQVSAVYSGKNAVSSIRTTWRGSASLRNSAFISLGVSNSGVSAGASSSWQNINTVTKYWENTNGAKESSCRSNMVVTPRKDYRSGTVSIINTARVKLSKDANHMKLVLVANAMLK